MKRNEIINIIAEAIKKADNSYFFEDYQKQAIATLAALSKKNLEIVLAEPTEEMIQKGIESIVYGRAKPTQLVKSVYKGMVKHCTDNS